MSDVAWLERGFQLDSGFVCGESSGCNSGISESLGDVNVVGTCWKTRVEHCLDWESLIACSTGTITELVLGEKVKLGKKNWTQRVSWISTSTSSLPRYILSESYEAADPVGFVIFLKLCKVPNNVPMLPEWPNFVSYREGNIISSLHGRIREYFGLQFFLMATVKPGALISMSSLILFQSELRTCLSQKKSKDTDIANQLSYL